MPPALTATHNRPTQNYLPQPLQASSGYQQQPAAPQRQPSPDRPTTVDPSHVYNRYHEYQKQIEAAEAEAARLAKLNEEQNAAEAARAAEQLRQDNLRAVREAEEAAAAEAAKTLAETMPADNADESESQSESEEEEEEQAEDNGDEDYEDEQQPADTGASGDRSQNTAALTKPSNPASSEQPMPAVATQAQARAPAKEDAAESMEEEMRRMVEKLRDYQSKDPKLFLQVWSSVRKNGGGTGQSPQSQAEGSLAQGSPSTRSAEVPLASPSPAVLQSEALPNAPVQEVVPASNPPSISPMTPGQQRIPSRSLSPNAKRRANRPSRSKAAIAERAAARAAWFAAAAAAKGAPPQPFPVTPSNVTVAQNAPSNNGSVRQLSAAPPATQAPQPVDDGQTTPAPVGSPAAKQLAQPGTETTPAVTPAPVGIPAANQRPQVGRQTTPAASTTPAGRPSYLNPSANPPPRPAGTWPNEQRDLIANTASTVLNAIPENAGKTIQPDQIRAMLEGNPSYMELCQMIEKMGFKMDRARFAKTLLAIIPHSSTRNPPASGPAQPLASGAARNRASEVIAYSTAPVSYGHPPGAVAQTSTQQSTPQAAPTAVMPTNAPGPPGGVYVSPVGQPTPSPVRRGRGRLGKDAQPPHSKIKPPESVQARTSVQAVQQETAMSTPQNYPPSSGPQPQNQGGSTPLSSEEMHQMSLLQAYVGKKTESTSQSSGGGANDSRGRDTQAYRLASQRQNQPGPGGPAAASGNRRLLPASYEAFWSTNQTQAPPVNQQQGQQSQPQNQPQNQPPASNQPALARYPSFSHYYSALVGSPGQAGLSGVSAYHSSIPVSNQPWPGQPQGKAGGPSQASHIPAASRPQQVPNTPSKPLTKAEAARKRTFAEIIDLTKEAAPKETVTCETGDEHQSKRSRVGDWNNNFPSQGALRVPPQPPQNTTSLNQPTTYQQFFPQQSHHINSRPATPQVEVIRNPLLEFDGIVKPIDSSVALRRSRYNPKTIARDVLISTGRHPTQRALNAHLEHLKERFSKVDNSSDLSTFRWDIIDPGGLPVGSANMEALPGSSGYSSSHASMRGQVRPSRGGSYSLTSTGVVPSRPSGLRNEIGHTSDFAIVIPATASASTPTLKRRGRPPRDPNATPKAETPKRPLGRPRRTPIIEQGTPARPTVDEYGNPIKRRGRPSKSAQKPVSRLSMPRYQAFLCEWRGCKAELLNLETLRKHILSVHGKTGIKDGIRCLWGKCAHEVIDLEDNGERPENVFGEMEAWKEHVEKKHLIPLAWHMGDGPRGSTLGRSCLLDAEDILMGGVKLTATDGNESDHSSYLLDSTGYQVTPSILEQAVEAGSAAANNERRAAERAARAQKKFSQWVYWCGPSFVPKPAIREGDFPARDADFEWQDPYRMLEEEYGDELRRAAKESEGLAHEKRVSVYSKEMPEELRRSLGVEG